MTLIALKLITCLFTKTLKDTPSCYNLISITTAATFTHLTNSMMGKALVTGLENSICICNVSWGFSESPMNWWRFISSRISVYIVGFLLCCSSEREQVRLFVLGKANALESSQSRLNEAEAVGQLSLPGGLPPQTPQSQVSSVVL